MKIQLSVILLVLSASVWGCDNEANLLSNNRPGPENNDNNPPDNNPDNNTTGMLNNTTGMTNNTTGPNNPTTNNISPNNETDPEIYDEDPGADTRDLTGDIPAFAGTGPVEQFAYDMMVAACERWVSCDGERDAFLVSLSHGISNVGECVEWSLARNPLDGFSRAVAEEKAQFLPDDAPLCATRIAEHSCDDLERLLDSPRAVVQACQDAYFGLTGLDGICASNAECTAELKCSKAFVSGCSGVCQDSTKLEVLCGVTLEPCAPNQYCAGGTTCTDILGEGEACETFDECGPDGFCRAGVCAPKKYGFQAGQSCNLFSNICALGLNCDVDAGDGVQGTCAEYRGAGEPCASEFDCNYETFCSNDGMCEPKVDTGSCDNPAECLSGVCTTEGQCLSSSQACAIPPEGL